MRLRKVKRPARLGGVVADGESVLRGGLLSEGVFAWPVNSDLLRIIVVLCGDCPASPPLSRLPRCIPPLSASLHVSRDLPPALPPCPLSFPLPFPQSFPSHSVRIPFALSLLIVPPSPSRALDESDDDSHSVDVSASLRGPFSVGAIPQPLAPVPRWLIPHSGRSLHRRSAMIAWSASALLRCDCFSPPF
jgi:hypothetical protein